MGKGELEQTLVLIKPDAMKNSLTGYVLAQLSEFHTGLCFAGLKVVQVTRMLAEEHYVEHRGKGFYSALLDYIMGFLHYPDEPHRRRVVAIVYQGVDAVQKVRAIAGPTNPHVARDEKPGCIRALGTLVPILDENGKEIDQRMDNLIHASATLEEAEREIKLWFRPNDIPPEMRAYETQGSEEHFYYKGETVVDAYAPGAVCILAPGDVAWASDLRALQTLRQGLPAPYSLRSIVAKYLLNRRVSFDW
ncbi:MAG: nucleoside-diphosphate kinase [Deltaproteobacteria bacterium]|nr:nucleoside-diphosphate kinase [Deltaproteobacteria bacterium]